MRRPLLQLLGNLLSKPLYLALVFGWPFCQIDVNIVFLNGLIEEEVCINQPRGFELHAQDTHVWMLNFKEGPLWAEAGTSCMVLED
jgi:hypothetical protein